MSGETASRERRRRLSAVALALLFLTTAPLASLTTVSAQDPATNVTLRFDREKASYMEGEKVLIRVTGAQVGMRTEVSCNTCPDKEKVYSAATRDEMVFPDDFGAEARNDRQPKWNDTWSVKVVFGGNTMAHKRFTVLLADVYRYADNEPHVSTLIRFQSAGLTPGEMYQFIVRKRTSEGTFETRFVRDVVGASDGVTGTSWIVDATEAERFRCPGFGRDFCRYYEITVRGPGKMNETMGFLMKPATAAVNIIRTERVSGGPEVFERTERVERILEIEYPFGYRVKKADMERPVNPEGVMRVRIDRYEGDGGDVEKEVRAHVRAIFNPERDLWYVNWTVPRNETLRVDHRYRMVLEEQQDKYGNTIPEVPIANFTVNAALLAPVVEQKPERVERLDLAKVVLALRYHDGSPLEPGDNATAIRGCFVKDDPGVSNCRNGFGAKVEYWKDGLWNFTYRFPVDYPDLSDHQFLFEGGAANGGVTNSGQDKWGNTFQNQMSAPFPVVPASLRINLTTAVGSDARNETRGLDRGDLVAITADIRYPDGSPFNRTMNHQAEPKIPVIVTKHGRQNAAAGQFTLNLTNVNDRTGFWTGSLQVSRESAESPVGNWTFRFRVKDNITPANANDTVFKRAVHAASIQLTPTSEPPRTVPAGSVVPFRFRLVYSDGTSVTPNDLGTDFFLQAIRVNALRFSGVAVSGALFPSYDPGRDEWMVDWEVPRVLFQGEYAFKAVGQDRHGNFVDARAHSRPFETYTRELGRAVLSEPPTRVERRESVLVVFDGRDGDLHYQPRNLSHPPAIELQRFDATLGEWVVEERDVRAADAGGGDHVGEFKTTEETALGVYRFKLRGRDASFNLVNGTSREFTVVPTNVTRALFLPPPERVAKGQLITWTVQRENGDTVQNARVLFNGVDIRQPGNLVAGLGAVSGPIFTTGPDRFNFSWRVPFSSDSGDYAFVILGRDVYGNRITVDVPPVRAEPSVLSGRVLGSPERVVERGSDVTFLFAITYPNGDYFLAEGTPRVLVMNESGLVDQAQVTSTGLSFEAVWSPELQTPLDDYWFEVSGVDRGGNVFPALRSDEFRLAPGVFERGFNVHPNLGYQRVQSVRAEVLSDPSDTFIAFTLAYVGDLNVLSQALVDDVPGDTVANLEHRVDANTGRYIVDWKTQRDTKVGVYRLEFTGRDAHGNEFRGQSEPFSVRETTIVPALDTNIPDSAFGPGKTIEVAFTLSYPPPANTPLDDSVVTPDARVLWDGNPVQQRPDVFFDDTRGQWIARWSIPADLPPGAYGIIVSGQDDSGNPIATRASRTFEYAGPPAVTGLLRLVPGAELPAALALLGLAALVAGRRRGREE